MYLNKLYYVGAPQRSQLTISSTRPGDIFIILLKGWSKPPRFLSGLKNLHVNRRKLEKQERSRTPILHNGL
jgi:hypothetical protein